MIDVVPLGPGVWLARCECGTTEKFPDAGSGWEWVLAHPCEPQPDEKVAFFRGRCLKCHGESAPECSLPHEARLQTNQDDDLPRLTQR